MTMWRSLPPTSRRIVAQAAGVLSAHGALPIDVAETRLREYARAQNLDLHEVAQTIVNGHLPLNALR
jgi:AmiR/NasT family two-component response regulator